MNGDGVLEITGNHTIMGVSNVMIGPNVIIKSGATLNITAGATVDILDQPEVIIEEGAIVNISIETCTPNPLVVIPSSTIQQEISKKSENIIASTDDKETTDEVNIYPNPASKEVLLDVNAMVGLKTINIFDNSGKIVRQSYANLDEIVLDISTLSNGIYFVHIQTEKEKVIKRLIVSNN